MPPSRRGGFLFGFSHPGNLKGINMNNSINVGARIRVLTGVYVGKEGQVDAMSNAPKNIGVALIGDKVQPLTWFKTDEIELLS